MKIALVHDWLLNIGGGEKVLEALCEIYDAPIYTLFANEETRSYFSHRIVYTSYLQRFPKVKRYYQNLLPLFPKAIESFDLSSYDLIISSSHSVAKGIRTHSKQIHICYCHTPMRYAWDLKEFHLKQLFMIKRVLARPILHALSHWDRKTHTRVNEFIANSRHVADRIQHHYERSSKVIYPPVDTDLFSIHSQKEDYYVTCCRLVPYKRVDLFIKAFAKLPEETLHIIGDGPEMKKLKAKATKNVKFLGHLPHPALRGEVAKAKAFLFAAQEDFGIAVVEAQAAGVPVIAYESGGVKETILPARTGIFFKEQTPISLLDALIRFEKMQHDFEPEKIKKHAEQFSKTRFKSEIQSFVEERIAKNL